MNEVVTDKRLNGREKLTRMFTASLQNTEQGKFFRSAGHDSHAPSDDAAARQPDP